MSPDGVGDGPGDDDVGPENSVSGPGVGVSGVPVDPVS